MCRGEQLSLFPGEVRRSLSLPVYAPARPGGFQITRIVLCRGSLDTEERETFVRRICALYPHVPVEERLGTPHNRLELGEKEPTRRIARGKRTLVFGELGLKNAVWMNDMSGAMYPHERFFSVYGFCPFGCTYCYLNASPGVWHSPVVKVYVNLPEILAEVDRQARAANKEITFYLGQFQDGLALDPLTAYSTVLIPFFAGHSLARLWIQTKSADVDRLLALEHRGRTTISWTLTPAAIAERYEVGAPSVTARIDAMCRCARQGYPVGVNISPVIPHGDWEREYLDLASTLLSEVPLKRLYIGTVCMTSRTLNHLETSMGRDNAISRHLEARPLGQRDSVSYRRDLCDGLFRQVLDIAQKRGPVHVTHERVHERAMAAVFPGPRRSPLDEGGPQAPNRGRSYGSAGQGGTGA